MSGNKRNLQKELEKIIENAGASGIYPKLLLHICCAPCSSYCMEYLSRYFDITVFFYNPNIDEQAEYIKRVEEAKRLISAMRFEREVKFIEGRYEPDKFHLMSRGMELLPEGGERCFHCYEMRLRESAIKAKELNFDYFTTSLSISPMKSSAKLCEIGERVGEEYGINYLPSDFKKKNGYKRSVELSGEYRLYRQNYCGCSYSRNEAMKRENTRRLAE